MKKTLALILSLLMVVSVMAMAVSAGTGNTWTDPSVETVPMNNSTKIAYRFATQGTGGLVGIQPYTAGTAGVTFSVKAYEWKYNYETTVAQEPLTAKTGLTFDGKTAYLPITFDKVLPAGGEYLIEICDVVIPAGGWALCQYVFSANANGAFKVYKNGVGSNNTLQWQLVFEEGGWYKGGAALSEDTEAPGAEPEAPKLPEQVTYVNTWGSPDLERFDGKGTAALAYRFATQGSGKLIGLNPQMGGDKGGKFDLLVYKWDSNYETTVAGTPVLEMKEIVFDNTDGRWTDYNGNDTTNGPAILFPEGLEGGEYLFVITNVKDTWAICNYITDAKTNDGCTAGSFKVYKDGVASDNNLKWQLIFEKGGWIKTDVLAADTPVIVPPAFGDDSYVVDVDKFEEGYKIAGSEHEGVEDGFYRAVAIPVVVVKKDGSKVLAMDYSESGVGFVRFFGASPADTCKPVATYGSKFTMSYRVFLDVPEGAGSLIFRDRLTDSKDNAGFDLLSIWSNGAVEAGDGTIAWGFKFGEWVTVTNVYDMDAATVSTYANDKLLFTQNLPTGSSGNIDWSDFCYQALGKNANDADTGIVYLADVMWERGLNAPETSEPETSEPVVTEPTTQAPVTQAPTTQAPTTQAPATTEAPASSDNTPVPPQGDNALISVLALVLVSGLAVSFVTRKKR